MKCGDCGKRIDLRRGATMRTPLDPTMICLPCDEVRRSVTQSKGQRTMNIDITIKDLSASDALRILTAANGATAPAVSRTPVEDELPTPKTATARSRPAPAPEPEEEEAEAAEEDPEEAPEPAPTRRGPPPPRVSPSAVAQAAAAGSARGGRKAEAAPAPKPKAAAARRPEPEPEPEEVEEEAAPLEEEQEEEPPRRAAAVNGKANGHSNGVRNGASRGGLDPRLTEAKKLKDVVNFFLDQGINDADEMVEKCIEVKDHVPVLQRISDVPTRVKRTLEVVLSGEDAV